MGTEASKDPLSLQEAEETSWKVIKQREILKFPVERNSRMGLSLCVLDPECSALVDYSHFDSDLSLEC